MKLLIIGGTRFLGRHLLNAALARDHEVTLFNRGNYSTQAPANVETIVGDRHTELHKLNGRRWDAVVDTCGHLPRAVRAAAEALADSVNRYVFISSQNAYADVSIPDITEDYPRGTLTEEQLNQANAIDTKRQPSYGALYGGLKALCERAAEEVMPGRVLVLRPGSLLLQIRRGDAVRGDVRIDQHVERLRERLAVDSEARLVHAGRHREP